MDLRKIKPQYLKKPNPRIGLIALASDFMIEKDFVNVIKPKKTILTNLGIQMDYNQLKKRLPKNIIPAYDGLVINL